MSSISSYWTLVKLSANGRSRAEELPSVKTFFQQQFPHVQQTEIGHSTIQQHLVELIRNTATDANSRTLAELCLRCFISHQIEQVCVRLAAQFGDYYGFACADLLSFVLDDDGSLRSRSYQPLGVQILQSFEPDRASLATWTIRLVKHHYELNRFLLERGICMLSDWALLNDTKLKKLQRVLSQFYQLTPFEVQQASILLSSYHAVYRRDRLQQRQKGQCSPPTAKQLQEIALLMQEQTAQLCSPTVILTRLQLLAERLRQYRIAAKGGNPPEFLVRSDTAKLENTLITNLTEPTEDSAEFLQRYRQQFLTCLENALAQAVSDRLASLKSPKDRHFLTALHLSYCQELVMSEIAKQIGLQAQYQVTRLLNLKALRANVRHLMLQCLRKALPDLARAYVDLNQLERADSQIDVALNEQIDILMQTEQTNAKTPKSYLSRSLFAQRLCRYLDRQLVANR